MSEMMDKFYKSIDDIKNMFTVAQVMAENSFEVSEENKRLRETLIIFRKGEEGTVLTVNCGKCRKTFNSLELFDCPFCEEQALQKK